MNEPILTILGSVLPVDSRAVAIVGTRTPTSYGKEVAHHFAYALAQSGITIISGLARGIDSIAHKGALDAGGRTIAVLGSGIDVIYPPENKDLAEEIQQHGAIVSPFPNGAKPLPKHFLQRNALIVQLSLAVLVIEGKRFSGTLSTANHAANMNREVFAVPGPVNSAQSQLPNYLIESGANMANSPVDILEYINKIYD